MSLVLDYSFPFGCKGTVNREMPFFMSFKADVWSDGNRSLFPNKRLDFQEYQGQKGQKNLCTIFVNSAGQMSNFKAKWPRLKIPFRVRMYMNNNSYVILNVVRFSHGTNVTSYFRNNVFLQAFHSMLEV